MSSTLTRLPKLLLALAAVLGALGGLGVLLIAGAIQVSESNGGPQTIARLNWVEAQGAWGIIILVIFSALYYGPYRFFAGGQRGMVVVFVMAAVILTFLASFSIGIYYWPAALAALLGLAAMLLQPGFKQH